MRHSIPFSRQKKHPKNFRKIKKQLFLMNKTFLQSKRSSWQDPFFDTLKARIDTAIQTYLGVDSAKDLRQATQALTLMQKQAIKDLAKIQKQISPPKAPPSNCSPPLPAMPIR
jgi:hypothetical protein